MDIAEKQAMDLINQSVQPIQMVPSVTEKDLSDNENIEEFEPMSSIDIDLLKEIKDVQEDNKIEEDNKMETVHIKEDVQLEMFDENLKPNEAPVDIYTIPKTMEKDCWQTPQYIKDYIYNRFGKDGYMFDPCPTNPKENGLLIDWKSHNYVNPPYSRGIQIQWVKKAIKEAKKGKEVFVLIPSDTSTKIWNEYVMKYAYIIYFVKGRIKFVGAPGMPKFGNALVHFNNSSLGIVACETVNFKDNV